MKTLPSFFSSDVGILLEFQIVATDFDVDDPYVAAALHVVRWPDQPGSVGGAQPPRTPVMISGGVATYETVEGDFEPGVYSAQVRLELAYTVVNTEVFRMVVLPAV